MTTPAQLQSPVHSIAHLAPLPSLIIQIICVVYMFVRVLKLKQGQSSLAQIFLVTVGSFAECFFYTMTDCWRVNELISDKAFQQLQQIVFIGAVAGVFASTALLCAYVNILALSLSDSKRVYVPFGFGATVKPGFWPKYFMWCAAVFIIYYAIGEVSFFIQQRYQVLGSSIVYSEILIVVFAYSTIQALYKVKKNTVKIIIEKPGYKSILRLNFLYIISNLVAHCGGIILQIVQQFGESNKNVNQFTIFEIQFANELFSCVGFTAQAVVGAVLAKRYQQLNQNVVKEMKETYM